MDKALKIQINTDKNHKTAEEISELIKEFFKNRGETLAEEELTRTVRAYIYLTDDRIPIGAAVMGKRK